MNTNKMDNLVVYISRNNVIKDFQIETDQVTVGRAPHCSISMLDNKYLSKHHVTLHVNKQLKEIRLEVLSNNGVLLNGEVCKKSQTVPLTSEDKVHLVHQANDGSQDIILTCGFTQTQASSHDSDTDNTLEYDFEEDKEQDEEVEEKEEAKSIINSKKRKFSLPDTQSTSKVQRLNSDDVIVKPTESCKQSTKTEAMKENLMCSICQDIFHDCVSCLPCMHSYCGGCFAEWNKHSSQCPTCRKQVASVNKNHTLNNLSAAYLQMYPEPQRSVTELEELDKKNIFKDKDAYELDDSNYPSSGSDSQDEENSEDVLFISPDMPSIRTCRECPNAGSLASLPNTGRTCSSNAPHLVCSCCNQVFPSGPDHSMKKCASCTVFFCHLYWECRSPGCRGCINHIKDVPLTRIFRILKFGRLFERRRKIMARNCRKMMMFYDIHPFGLHSL